MPTATSAHVLAAPRPARTPDAAHAFRPLPLYPVDGEPADGNGLRFGWTPVDSARYHLQIAADARFATLLVDAESDAAAVEVADALPPGALFWRVRCRPAGDARWHPFSRVATCRIAAPRAAEPLSPAGNAPVDAGSVALRWPHVDGAGAYVVEVAADADFAERELRLDVDYTLSLSLLGLLPADERRRWWRVRPAGGPWSAPATFRPVDAPARPPMLVRRTDTAPTTRGPAPTGGAVTRAEVAGVLLAAAVALASMGLAAWIGVG